MDFSGLAAIGGVALAAVTTAGGGIVARGRMRRMERLVEVMGKLDAGSSERKVLLAMVADNIMLMNYRQRGPKSWWQVAVAWVAQVLGYSFAVIAYIGVYSLVLPYVAPATSGGNTETSPWLGLALLVAIAVALIYGGVSVLNGTKTTREAWIAQHTPAPSVAPGDLSGTPKV